MRVNPLVLTREASLELPYRSWRIALELLGIGTALVGSIMSRPQFLRQVSRWSESRFGMDHSVEVGVESISCRRVLQSRQWL